MRKFDPRKWERSINSSVIRNNLFNESFNNVSWFTESSAVIFTAELPKSNKNILLKTITRLKDTGDSRKYEE